MRWQGQVGSGESVESSVPVGSAEEIMSMRAVLVLSIVSLAWSTLFWFPRFSGSAISDFAETSASFFGVVLFVLAIVGFFVYAKKRESLYLID